MKRIAWFLLVSFVFFVFNGCIVVRRPSIAPPPPRTEVVIAKPGPDYIWISGYWGWKSGKYVWMTGHWVKARPGRAWIAGHWEKRGQHWVWIKGRWRRR
jgi:hypothetical protein